MKKIEGLKDFELMDFSKSAGEEKTKYAEIYYQKKNNKIRMYDNKHIIKVSGNNLEFLEYLKNLNIAQINTPLEILHSKEDDKYYIVSKYLENYLELDYYKNKINFDEVLAYFIQILTILEESHNKDFFVGDIHSSNILISPNKKAYLFDFDQSIFIKDKILTIRKDETIFEFCENPYIKDMLKKRYGISEEELTFYNSCTELLKPIFIEYDKEYVLKEIIRLIFLKLDIKVDVNNLTYYDIVKLHLSRKFEKKIIECLIKDRPLCSNDYLIDELNELKGSRLVRKKLNR